MSKRLPTVQDVRGILKGHKIETEADEIERLTARVRELEGALRYYATMYCEGPEGACGKLDASDCDGCRARAAITKGESNG